MYRLSWNLGASTSWNPQGLSRPVMGLLYLYLYYTLSNFYAATFSVFKFYTDVTLTKLISFRNSIHKFRTLYEILPVLLPPQNFVHLPRCYYRYQETENVTIERILMRNYMWRDLWKSVKIAAVWLDNKHATSSLCAIIPFLSVLKNRPIIWRTALDGSRERRTLMDGNATRRRIFRKDAVLYELDWAILV